MNKPSEKQPGIAPVSVLFVCLGNICRSPTAHGVLRNLIINNELSDLVKVDSAGTGGWHVGAAPDERARQAALTRGYDIGDLRARQVTVKDFDHFDYILAMDRDNLKNLRAMRPAQYPGVLDLFLRFGPRQDYSEVPDPYFGGEDGFNLVMDLVHGAALGLLEHIRKQHGLE